ncbi:hypothetical protein [Streptomyces roseoverticillatus]|uniref:hypothetical protein n=1 Tax=Streptomyces roseoverticillatus TaxID=66429 RepID=UPI0004C1F0AD|nr:hypothetical protein [Streptomyces roseoverticillatus]
MPAPEQPQQPPTELRSEPSEPSEERPPSTSTSMRDLLASCAAADAVSKPPPSPETQGDGEQNAA